MISAVDYYSTIFKTPTMKNSVLIVLLLCFPVFLLGQISTPFGVLIYADTLEFDPLHSWITIDDPESNVWEVGTPSKDYFSEALSETKAMMTDSAHSYPVNLDDGFVIEINSYEYWWAEANLSFYHKYDTEYQFDGGIIEISHDNGGSWVEMREDDQNVQCNFIGLSQDTINGGEYAYTGISDGWQYVELHWLWLVLCKKDISGDEDKLLRFRFVSDDNDVDHEGWMIDDIVFRGYSVSGSIEGFPVSRVKAYPNPAGEVVNFLLDVKGAEIEARIYNLYGQLILAKSTFNNQIDVTSLEPGLYLFELYSNDAYISSGKFVKK